MSEKVEGKPVSDCMIHYKVAKGVLGWREKGRRERKIRISMNEFKLKIRPNTSIGIRIFLSSQFLSLDNV
jgi:hypothetical protein